MIRPSLAGFECPLTAYYRFVDDDAVLDYVGGYEKGFSIFAMSQPSLDLRELCIGESFSGESIVSRLSAWTGESIAPTANRLFDPLARVDYMLTGRFIRFSDHVARPIFETSSSSVPAEIVELPEIRNGGFEAFIQQSQ